MASKTSLTFFLIFLTGFLSSGRGGTRQAVPSGDGGAIHLKPVKCPQDRHSPEDGVCDTLKRAGERVNAHRDELYAFCNLSTRPGARSPLMEATTTPGSTIFIAPSAPLEN